MTSLNSLFFACVLEMLGFDLSVRLLDQQLFKVNILYPLLFSKYVYLCHVSWIEVFFIAVYICGFDIKWSFEHVVEKETTGGVVTSHCELLAGLYL